MQPLPQVELHTELRGKGAGCSMGIGQIFPVSQGATLCLLMTLVEIRRFHSSRMGWRRIHARVGCLNWRVGNIYVLLLHGKTCGYRYDERSTRCLRAFICRTCTNAALSDARGQPLDTLPQTAGISIWVGHAIRAGRTRAPDSTHQHDGDAYAESEGGPTRQLAGHAE